MFLLALARVSCFNPPCSLSLGEKLPPCVSLLMLLKIDLSQGNFFHKEFKIKLEKVMMEVVK